VLDLHALEKAQAAVDTIGHARGEERVLDDPRLGVRAVQHADVGEAQA